MKTTADTNWSADEVDAIAFEIEERAAIREYDGRESRADAERNAKQEVMIKWQTREK